MPEAYERLILDAMRGDATLFTRADEVDEQWAIVDAIVAAWKRDRPAFPNYAAGTWGPPSADDLLHRDGRPGGTTDGDHGASRGMDGETSRSRRSRTRSPSCGASRARTPKGRSADERDDAHRVGPARVAQRLRGRRSREWPSAIRRARSCSFRAGADEDGLDARVQVAAFSTPERAASCRRRDHRAALLGGRASAPASIVMPLLISDLPVFCRWRGRPDFGERQFEELVDVADRLIVDSTEWDDPARIPAAGRAVRAHRRLGHRVGRTRGGLRWRGWRRVGRCAEWQVKGTAAQAHLLAGWLRSRLDTGARASSTSRPTTSNHRSRRRGAAPPGGAAQRERPALGRAERFGRDRVYEAAVAAARRRIDPSAAPTCGARYGLDQAADARGTPSSTALLAQRPRARPPPGRARPFQGGRRAGPTPGGRPRPGRTGEPAPASRAG